MRDFTYLSHTRRILFAPGARKALGNELDRLGMTHPLIVTTKQRASLVDQLSDTLAHRDWTLFPEAAMHTPVAVTEEALRRFDACGADGVVSVGGGSTIGLGKALAGRRGLSHISLPTTYSGSEMTDILGETEGGRKTTRRAPEIRPTTVIYDVELTLGLPLGISGLSGMNAMAHAIEALYAPHANPVTDLMALEAIGVLAKSLPDLADALDDVDLRADLFYGSWLCGLCLDAAEMSLHHKICHTLGGSFDLPHAEAHAVMLPHALAYNAPAIAPVMARLVPLLGADPARALYDLSRHLGAPQSLSDLGMPEDGIAKVAQMALENPYANPRPLAAGPLTEMLTRAWRGNAPLYR
ncbi:maleylacetate reductase [Celeribacter indicus]|uniref:Maleylacetate reductase n=1 Tax=Celeribacter indicus TaxID=1208324 RepID=A0A0B5DPK5_9RHOB|nr:maleylacetate reductase [Celeribacter indicus]AJE45094.1 maleylacetate reductase [Celeribacter indicus]SDX27620.1 maleylacetate reductase [Celeribacter indicus]